MDKIFDLLTELKEGSEEYKSAIFATYTFDATFFERKVLPILQTRDIENVLVFIDPTEYKDSFSKVKLAGNEYYLDYCKVKKTFHPKFILLTWPEGGRLIVGSSNLTANNWLSAGQLLISLEYNTSRLNPDITSFFWEMKNFLLIFKKSIVRSEKHQSKIDELLETPWLKALESPVLSEKIRLLHNLDKSILKQLLEIVDKEKVLEVSILSPYFDLQNSIIKEFVSIGCKSFKIYLQLDRVIRFPKKEIENISGKDMEIKTIALKFTEKEDRYIHSKLFIIKTDKAAYSLFGSANATRAGLLSTIMDGNMELCILRKENDINYFDSILNNSSLTQKEINLDKIEVREEKIEDNNSEAKVSLTEAKIDGKQLIIEYETEPSNTSEISILINHTLSDPPHIIKTFEKSKNKLSWNIENYDFTEPTFVIIEFKTDSQTLQSEMRWISTQNLEMSPHKRDIQLIKESYGRLGLISFLNRLQKVSENPEWLLYCMQWINFEKLEDLDRVRVKVKTKRIPQEDQEEQEDLEQEEQEDLEQEEQDNIQKILEKILKRHQKKFESQSLDIYYDNNLSENLLDLLNLFLFINKLTIWLVLNEYLGIEELRYIKINIETFSSLLKGLNTPTYQNALVTIINQHHIDIHLILIAYIIEFVHRKENYTNRPENIPVIQAFMRQYKSTFNDLQDIGISFKFDDEYKKMFNNAIIEYNEFENLKITFSEFDNFIRYLDTSKF